MVSGYQASPRAFFDHHRTRLFCPGGHWEFFNDVRFQSWAKNISRVWTRNVSVTCLPTSLSDYFSGSSTFTSNSTWRTGCYGEGPRKRHHCNLWEYREWEDDTSSPIFVWSWLLLAQVCLFSCRKNSLKRIISVIKFQDLWSRL